MSMMKMKHSIVLVLVILSFSLLSHILSGCTPFNYVSDWIKGEAPTSGGYEEENEKEVMPTIPPDIVVYSDNTIPGNHVIIEVGLFCSLPEVKLKTILEGELSQPFFTDNRIYLLFGISYNNEPGEYELAFEIFEEGGESWEITEVIKIQEGEFDQQQFTVPPTVTDGWTADRLAEDREKIRRARDTTEPEPLWQAEFIWPLEDRISSDFGAIRIINNGPPQRHNGIDIAAPEGTPLVAANRGIVRLAEHLLASGNVVFIDHGLGLSSAYLHMYEIAVEEGQMVEKGDIIGTVGQTGFASGPHLHWSIYIGHTPISPYPLLDGMIFSNLQ